MDIWEANQFAEAVTPHPCSSTGLQRADCSSNAAQCASGGICDAAGCDFNSWRMGNQTFLGPGSGFTIDTTKPVQVVTQFISSDGTQNGDLIEIRRKFVQNGKVFDNSYSNIPGLTPYNSITDATCKAQKTAFSDTNDFATLGGLKVMGQAFKRGMVLVLSIWDDTSVSMLWLGELPFSRIVSIANMPRQTPTTRPLPARARLVLTAAHARLRPASRPTLSRARPLPRLSTRTSAGVRSARPTPAPQSGPAPLAAPRCRRARQLVRPRPRPRPRPRRPLPRPRHPAAFLITDNAVGRVCRVVSTQLISALTLIRLHRLHDLRLRIDVQVLQPV
jgi:hypothetical protein